MANLIGSQRFIENARKGQKYLAGPSGKLIAPVNCRTRGPMAGICPLLTLCKMDKKASELTRRQSTVPKDPPDTRIIASRSIYPPLDILGVDKWITSHARTQLPSTPGMKNLRNNQDGGLWSKKKCLCPALKFPKNYSNKQFRAILPDTYLQFTWRKHVSKCRPCLERGWLAIDARLPL